jgi:hypothetical protein
MIRKAARYTRNTRVAPRRILKMQFGPDPSLEHKDVDYDQQDDN